MAQENKSLKLRVGELDFNLQELTRERAELQSSIATNEKRLEDLSFCFTESEVQRGELEQKLSELKKMPALFEEEEANYLDGENSKGIKSKLFFTNRNFADQNINYQSNYNLNFIIRIYNKILQIRFCKSEY